MVRQLFGWYGVPMDGDDKQWYAFSHKPIICFDCLWAREHPHHTKVRITASIDYTGDWKVIAFSRKFWGTLTPAQQKILVEAAEQAQDEKFRLDKNSIEIDMGRLKEKGMQIQQMNLQQKELFRPYAQKVWTEFEPVIGTEVMNKMLRTVRKR